MTKYIIMCLENSDPCLKICHLSKHQILMSSPLFLLKSKWFKKLFFHLQHLLPLENAFLLTSWLIIFMQIIFSRHRIQSLNLISHFLQIQYNSEKLLNFFLQTNKIQEHLKLFELNKCISQRIYSAHNYTQGPAFV